MILPSGANRWGTGQAQSFSTVSKQYMTALRRLMMLVEILFDRLCMIDPVQSLEVVKRCHCLQKTAFGRAIRATLQATLWAIGLVV